jgi:hypothetical protein
MRNRKECLSPQRQELGHELNSLETTIHDTKENILTLRTLWPDDKLALDGIRKQRHETRLARNGIRQELETLKLAEESYVIHRWTVTGS